METVVLALGGNALIRPGEKGSYKEQAGNVRKVAQQIANVSKRYRLIVTHGNGPQVGHTVLRHEAARSQLPPFPLDACVAETQGFIGYLIQRSLLDCLDERHPAPVSIVTLVEVDPDDSAFKDPTKPIGPVYSRDEAEQLRMATPHLLLSDNSGKGLRRLVPSPKPKRILEAEVIKALSSAGHTVVCCGGGGIPVVRLPNGGITGMEAVIDKDLTSMRIAIEVTAERLIMLTDVEGAYLNYGTDRQQLLGEIGANRMFEFLRSGHFKIGSMEPKVRAALDFLESGGQMAVIGHLDNLEAAVEGQTGTRIKRS